MDIVSEAALGHLSISCYITTTVCSLMVIFMYRCSITGCSTVWKKQSKGHRILSLYLTSQLETKVKWCTWVSCRFTESLSFIILNVRSLISLGKSLTVLQDCSVNTGLYEPEAYIAVLNES